MNEYYGAPTTPTTDYLAHYGVEGMRWGVRKARDKGSDRALDRQWRKASKKLQKLQDNANIKKQVQLNKYHKANAIGYGVGTALYPFAGHAMTQLSKAGAMSRIAQKSKALENIPGLHMISDTYRDYKPWGYVAGAASLGGAIGSGIAARKARNRTTREGHAKAVRELNTWQREMNSAFKGTKYGKRRHKG